MSEIRERLYEIFDMDISSKNKVDYMLREFHISKKLTDEEISKINAFKTMVENKRQTAYKESELARDKLVAILTQQELKYLEPALKILNKLTGVSDGL